MSFFTYILHPFFIYQNEVGHEQVYTQYIVQLYLIIYFKNLVSTSVL